MIISKINRTAMKVKKIILSSCRFLRMQQIRWKYHRLYCSMNRHKKYDKRVENAWMHKWKTLDKKVSIDSFRIFSPYIGPDLNIVPLETAAIYIDPCLNNVLYETLLEDKNLYDSLIGAENLPKTILKNMNAFFYDGNYSFLGRNITEYDLTQLLAEYNAVVIKPTMATGSGKGVRVFYRILDKFVEKSGLALSVRMLNDLYGCNYVIQERMQQLEFMATFNSCSVNTIRCMTYRSVKDDKVRFCNAVLRIGGKGKDIDNAHAGGVFCGIDAVGQLGSYVCNHLGQVCFSFNGIDFNNESRIIPDYEKVKAFAINIAERIPYMRLLALDIMIDVTGKPLLIEFNHKYFSYWLFQFTNGTAFGDYTDEVIDYVINQRNQNPLKAYYV